MSRRTLELEELRQLLREEQELRMNAEEEKLSNKAIHSPRTSYSTHLRLINTNMR